MSKVKWGINASGIEGKEAGTKGKIWYQRSFPDSKAASNDLAHIVVTDVDMLRTFFSDGI